MELNLINDEAALSLQDFYQKALAETTHPLNRYESFFTLGLLAWRAGDIKKMHRLLANAAQEALAIVEQRDPLNTVAERIPHSVAVPFLLIINFGSEQDLTRLVKITRQQWFQPETHEYKPLADLLDILRHYWVGKKLDGNELNQLIELNEFPGVDLFYKPWIAFFSQGLVAILQKDPDAATNSLQALLNRHETMAFEGDWKNLVEGLLSFWALTLFSIAKKEGMQLGINSPYFPQ